MLLHHILQISNNHKGIQIDLKFYLLIIVWISVDIDCLFYELQKWFLPENIILVVREDELLSNLKGIVSELIFN